MSLIYSYYYILSSKFIKLFELINPQSIFWDKMSQYQTRKIFKRTISGLYVLSCFKYFQIYIFWTNVPQKI